MEALHDVVKAGKARYLGASSMFAWQFAKLQHAAGQGGWTRFVSMQNQYNLLRRQDEPELMAMCADTGVGLVPYSPQGKGRLARPWGEQSTRSSVDHVVQAFDSPWTNPSSTPCRHSPGPAVSPWPRSHSRGCCAIRRSAPRSSARPNRITCPKPPPRSSST
jgi:Aldo/keto reductase family